MFTIGLCGGSGSGKGRVCEFFASFGVPSIDTDAVYREITSEPGECLSALVNEFGSEIISQSGALNRQKLAAIVFSGEDAKKKLERLNAITHKYILDETRKRLESYRVMEAVCAIVDAPVLFESGFDSECDFTICVVADRESRIDRIISRDSISREQAEQRISSQMTDEELISRSNFVIRNDSDLESLCNEVKAVTKQILEIYKRKVLDKMSEKTIGQEMLDKLSYKKKNIFEEATPEKIKAIYDYSEGYKTYLDNSKTEREATDAAIELAKAQGYTEYKLGDKISVGDKKYLNQHGKSLILFKVGENNLESEGIRIVAAHVDSPRLDLKQVPMYEDSGMAFLKTHYYGGVKKYQWTSIPLAIHGVMVKADGEVVKVCIGEDDSDPIFYINDLLPHLGADQSQKPLGSAISGETLNILIGGLPYDDKDVSEKVKLTALSILHDKYGVTEEDFLSAELSLVPAFKARDIGFDRALIASYGHDDRVCSYPAVTALLDNADTKQTVMVVLADKEEIGSVGFTGMQSAFLVDLITEISNACGKNPIVVRSKSKCLSADVTACYDPNFAEVYEKRNSALISCGTTMSKYTGSRGKSGTNDATAEFVGYVRKLFNENGVIWQTGELGKVDQGGGGTVAMYIANHNIATVDLGVPVISMHAPYEVVSKADVYSTYEAFCAFVK